MDEVSKVKRTVVSIDLASRSSRKVHVRRTRLRIKLSSALALLAFAGSLQSRQSVAGPGESESFGVYFATQFDDPWVKELRGSGSAARAFSRRLDDVWENEWGVPRTLRGTKKRFERSCDGCKYGLDRTDLVLVITHSGLTRKDVEWYMMDSGSVARSSKMKLGDEKDGLRGFISYSCSALRRDASKHYKDRWRQIFDGGLVFALGSGECLTNSTWMRYYFEDFADKLIAGETFWSAWKHSFLTKNNRELRQLHHARASFRCSYPKYTLESLTSAKRFREAGKYWCHTWVRYKERK